MKVLAVVLVVLGLVGLIWGGLTYTTSKKIVDLGPIQASKETEHSIPVPPIVGAILLVGGVVLLATGKK